MWPSPRLRSGLFALSLLCSCCTRKEHREAQLHPSDRERGVNAPSAVGSAELPLGKAHPAFNERQTERDRLVRLALEDEDIKDERVLRAMRKVPRHMFVPEASRAEAYANRPLAIGYGQTISQPYIVAAMTEAAAPKASDRCLEIGTGSGYQAAVLAELCAKTYSIEYLPEVAAFGERNLRALGYGADTVELRVGDGFLGWPEAAPFQVILVTAAPEKVPPPLLEQLALHGRLVIPLGPEHGVQQLERWTRQQPGTLPEAFTRDILMGVRFVPFLGDEVR